ncbi:hypothetical protein N136_03672, partial [Leifsonia aquatica ATCC 14665]
MSWNAWVPDDRDAPPLEDEPPMPDFGDDPYAGVPFDDVPPAGAPL